MPVPGVQETTTATAVGPGLVRPMGVQHAALADEFFHRFSRMNHGGLQQAFSDYTRARELDDQAAEELRQRLHQVYGLTGLQTRLW